VINRSFPGYHWIYWIGPLLGSLLACGFYYFLRMFSYESVNPGQDFNEWEAKRGPGSWDFHRPSYSDTTTINTEPRGGARESSGNGNGVMDAGHNGRDHQHPGGVSPGATRQMGSEQV
jgi:aquaporin related protein